MPSGIGSKFGAFLDTYNQSNTYLQHAADAFIARIGVDANNLVNNSDGILKDKAFNLTSIIDDKSHSSYERLIKTGSILEDIAKDVVNAANQEVKQSGGNLIKSFFDVAKQTEDQQLLSSALQIAKVIPF